MILLVANEGTKLIGIAHLIFHRTTIAEALTCYLQDLFVAPEARARGVAGKLIDAATEQAREAGSGKLYWQTHESNVPARRLYDRMAEHRGFIVYSLLL